MRAPILCVGALIADVMMHLEKLPLDPGKHLPKDARFVAAGMATSAATAIARLGQPVRLWALTGSDALGDFLLAELVRDDIDVRHVRRVPDVMSAISTILVDSAGERIVVPYYAPELMSLPPALPPFAEFSAVLADVRWPAAAGMALRAAKVRNVPAILDLDVGPKGALEDLLHDATHVVASLDGARTVTGATNLRDAVTALRERCTAEAVVVTAGQHGASWCSCDSAEVRHQSAFAVDAVDTNAAGDVFHGAFAVRLVERMPLPDIIRFASAAAAIKCTRPGGRSGAPTRGEVEALLAERAEPQREYVT